MCARPLRRNRWRLDFQTWPGQNNSGEEKNENALQHTMEDMLYELVVCEDLEETGILRTVILADGTNVTLVGANHASKVAARFAETIVFRVQPSALVLELCSERAGVLIQGNGHRQSRAKSWMNPDEPEWLRRQYATYADETRRAFRAFMKYSKPVCRLLVFADMKASVVEHDIENMQERRDANLAANIHRTARLGHKNIVAVLGANHLDGASVIRVKGRRRI